MLWLGVVSLLFAAMCWGLCVYEAWRKNAQDARLLRQRINEIKLG